MESIRDGGIISFPATLDTASAMIHRLFADASISNEVSSAIINAYNGLDCKSVAVRSSATAEDLPDASFAGQQETFLNICDEKDLLDAVKNDGHPCGLRAPSPTELKKASTRKPSDWQLSFRRW